MDRWHIHHHSNRNAHSHCFFQKGQPAVPRRAHHQAATDQVDDDTGDDRPARGRAAEGDVEDDEYDEEGNDAEDQEDDEGAHKPDMWVASIMS